MNPGLGEPGAQLGELGVIASVAVEPRLECQRLTQIHQRVAPDREREARLERVDAIYPDDHQRAGVENRDQRREPRLVVVLRAEEAQDRVGDVALEHLGERLLPVR